MSLQPDCVFCTLTVLYHEPIAPVSGEKSCFCLATFFDIVFKYLVKFTNNYIYKKALKVLNNSAPRIGLIYKF